MLVMNDMNINFNAVSNNANGEQVASMSASNSSMSTYFNITVDKNDPVIDADFSEFKKAVFDALSGTQKSAD